MFGMKETLQESILYGTKVTGVNQIWKNNAKARSIYTAYIGTEGTWSMQGKPKYLPRRVCKAHTALQVSWHVAYVRQAGHIGYTENFGHLGHVRNSQHFST